MSGVLQTQLCSFVGRLRQLHHALFAAGVELLSMVHAVGCCMGIIGVLLLEQGGSKYIHIPYPPCHFAAVSPRRFELLTLG